MTLQECYTAMGADYESAINYLRSDKLLQKYVLKFLDDKSFQLLSGSIKDKNYEEAFRASHTIKGVSQNLCFSALIESSKVLTEYLRNGCEDGDTAAALFQNVKSDYEKAVSAIGKFREELLVAQ